MEEQQPSSGSPAPPPAAPAALLTPPPGPEDADRRSRVVLGGLLAGLGFSLAVALLMHVVQEASPIGYGLNIDGPVLVVVFLAGPIFGLGLAVAMAALIQPAVSGERRPGEAGR